MTCNTAFLLLLFSCHALTESTSRDDRGFFSNMFTRRPPLSSGENEACSCSCGERNFGGRIVGGDQTQVNEFPWMVRLSYFNRFYCAGMLINDRYVLTAAHCVKGFMWFMIKATFGEHDRCDKNFKPETRFVLRALHGEFSFLNFDNDVALLRLNDRVPITETIKPICLPKTSGSSYVGTTATVAGWGTLMEDGKPACTLQEVALPVMSNEECKRTNYKPEMITHNMMCAGYPKGGKDSCQGDSGGPLIKERSDTRYEIIGIVSWGNGCGRPGYPGIYTRVTRYLDWIRKNSADACWCDDSPEEENKPTTQKPHKPATQKPHKPTTEKPESTTNSTQQPETVYPTGNMTILEPNKQEVTTALLTMTNSTEIPYRNNKSDTANATTPKQNLAKTPFTEETPTLTITKNN